MNTYEITNPSDPITVQADEDLVAAAAALLLGHGKYGARRGDTTVCPIFILGGYEEWAKEVGFGREYIDKNWLKIVACLRTAAVGTPPQEIRDDAVKLAAWNEQKRSSMNDISAAAVRYAAELEKNYKGAA